MRKILRQPLFWFAIAGACLFLIDALFVSDRNEIYVSAAQQQRLATLWQTQTGLTASEEELDSLVRNWIREEILYQEALRLGLDRQDSIIRRRLVQKLGFIAESESSAAPEVGVLQTFYQQNIDAYTLPLRYSLRQLYFQTEDDARQALAALELGTNASTLGESSMLNAQYAYRSALDLNATFGNGFSDRIAQLPVQSWQGPVLSGFGYHLIQLIAIHGEEFSPFDSVQSQVAMDYQQFQQMNARDAYIEELIDQYNIVLEPR